MGDDPIGCGALTATGAAAAPPAAPASESLSPLAVVAIAVLAGAISGSAMTALGRKTRSISGPSDEATEELTPAGGTLTTR